MSRMISTSRARSLPGVALGARRAWSSGSLALAGCSGGGRRPAARGVTDAIAGPTGVPGDSPATTHARPTEVPGRPVASLGGGVAGSVPGELGTFLWDGLGSDSPWIVPPGAVPAAPGAPLAVTLDPAARAPAVDRALGSGASTGSAGDPAAVASGRRAHPSWWRRRCHPAPGASRWRSPSPGAGARPGTGASAWVRRPACPDPTPTRARAGRPDAAGRHGSAAGHESGGASSSQFRKPARQAGDGQAIELAATGLKIETWTSSGSMTPKIFSSARRCTQEPQLSK